MGWMKFQLKNLRYYGNKFWITNSHKFTTTKNNTICCLVNLNDHYLNAVCSLQLKYGVEVYFERHYAFTL